MRRPAFITFLAFSFGIISAYFSNFPLSYIASFLLVICSIYLISNIFKFPQGVLNLSCIFIVVASGMLLYEVSTTLFPTNHIINYADNASYNRKDFYVIAKIIKDPEVKITQTIIECEAESVVIDSHSVQAAGKINLTLGYPDEKFEYGDRLKLNNPKLLTPEFPKNPEDFNYKEFLARNKIYVTARTSNIEFINNAVKEFSILKIALRIKRFINNTISANLTLNQASLLKGLVTGERGLLPPEVYEQFQNTGTIHILAISGFNVGLIALIVFLGLTLFRVPLAIKRILTAAFIIIYAFVVGLEPPIVRSTIMTILGMIALTAERDSDMLNVIAFSGLIILFFNPQSLFDISFQLSFIAIISLIYLSSEVYTLLFYRLEFNAGKYLGLLLSTSLSAQIGIIPIVTYYFYRISIISIIANLFIIPLSSLCIILTFLISFFSLIHFHLMTGIFSSIAWITATVTLKSAELFGAVPYANAWVHKPNIVFVIWEYFVIIGIVEFFKFNKDRKLIIYNLYAYLWTYKPEINCVVWKHPKILSMMLFKFNKGKNLFIYAILIGIIIFIWSKIYVHNNSELKLVCLSKTSATIIKTQDKQVILIDGGGDVTGMDKISPYLRSNGISKINCVVITNPDEDKTDGLKYVFNNFKINKVIVPDECFMSLQGKKIFECIRDKNIPYSFMSKEYGWFKYNYGDVDFLFSMGDKMCMFVKSKNDSIVVASKESDIDKEVQTQKVLVTDSDGAVFINTDGKKIKYETMKGLITGESLKHKSFRYLGVG
ncbi:MAG: ComEC/Rec2 family competence protein [bacterium]|nr:ComEC/Rec2 family competence protein [bacterium]